MKLHLKEGVVLLIFSSGLLQASEPKTGTLIQFGALGFWVVFSSFKIAKSIFRKNK
ncbi:MAG: hypothetical protein V4507_05970 [Verrucomicrobiota bacterium]